MHRADARARSHRSDSHARHHQANQVVRVTASTCAANTRSTRSRQFGNLQTYYARAVSRRRRRTDAHDARRHAGGRDAAQDDDRIQSVLRAASCSRSAPPTAPSLIPDACLSHRAALGLTRPSASRAHRSWSRTCSSCVTECRLFAGDRHATSRRRSSRAPALLSITLLQSRRERVLIVARYSEVTSTFSRLRHLVDSVLRLHQLVDETPADVISNTDVAARKRRVGLSAYAGRARHP